MQHEDHKKETTTTMYECQTSYCGNDGEDKSRKSRTKREEMIVTVCECRREKCSEGGSTMSRRGLLLSDDVLVIVDDERDFEGGRRLLEMGMIT